MTEELYELYAELHLACGRAATALKLSAKWDTPPEDLMQRYREEDERAAALWARIKEHQAET
jgi:hypothetical protein